MVSIKYLHEFSLVSPQISKPMYVPESGITLSISIITYNQEKYISRAIEGVLAQEVDFQYEIIIGDDCSSDRTPQILKEYQERYPDRIQLILHPRRYNDIPGRTNNMTNLYACRGKYIAVLDGDDYWLSTNKLQTQVDFLENNPDFSLTFHETLMTFEENNKSIPFSNMNTILKEKKVFDQQEFFAQGYIAQTSTCLYRNLPFGEFPAWFNKIYSADVATQLLLLNYGKARYFEDLKGVYWRNESSVSYQSKKEPDFHLHRIANIRLFQNNFKFNKLNRNILRRKKAVRYYLQAILDLRRGKIFRSAKHFSLANFHDPKTLSNAFKSIWKKRLRLRSN